MSALTFFFIVVPFGWWTGFGLIHFFCCWSNGDHEKWTTAQTIYMNFICGPGAWLCIAVLYLVVLPLEFISRVGPRQVHRYIFNRLGK